MRYVSCICAACNTPGIILYSVDFAERRLVMWSPGVCGILSRIDDAEMRVCGCRYDLRVVLRRKGCALLSF